MNLTIRFNNGVWKLFDLARYTDVKTFGTRKEAEVAIGRRGVSRNA